MGRWIVTDGRGRVSPSGADLMKVDEDELIFTQIRDYHSSFGQIIAGPFNRFWTFGSTLYPLDITNPVRKFSGAAVRVHPRFNLAASFSDSVLYFERFSDAAKLEEVQLAPAAGPTKDLRGRPLQVPDVMIDFLDINDLVFVGTNDRGYLVDLKTYAEKLEPSFVIRAPTEVAAIFGQELKIPLSVSKQARSGNLRLLKKSGPESVQVTNSALTYSPKATDVGIHEVRMELIDTNSKEVLDTADLKLHIKLPKIAIGFPIKTMQRSPDDRYAVLWGPSKGQEGRHPAHTGSDDIAIVDLTSRSILATKSMPTGIRTAGIDSKFVYVAPNSGSLIYRIDHTLKKYKRYFLKSAPQSIFSFAGNRFAIESNEQVVFDSATMKPIEMVALTGLGNVRSGASLSDHRTVTIGGRVIDRNKGDHPACHSESLSATSHSGRIKPGSSYFCDPSMGTQDLWDQSNGPQRK